jgi:hypothetical protein
MIDREVLAVLTTLAPLERDSRLQPALRRLEAKREFDVEAVLAIGTWSSGEVALIEWAGALWAGRGQVDVGYIAGMSDRFLHACLGALAAYAGRDLPGFTSHGAAVRG